MRHSLVPLLLLAGAASAEPPRNEAVLVSLVDGAVNLRGGTVVLAGERLAVPLDLDTRGGSASLVWEASGVRLLAEGVDARVHQADERGVRVSLGDTRVHLPPGQGVYARHRPEKTPKVFLRAATENSGAITLASCQTLVHLLPGSSVSVSLDRDGHQVVVQGEAGLVEFVGRERSGQLLTGERFVDGCVPPPGEGSIDPQEARSPLTPFTP